MAHILAQCAANWSRLDRYGRSGFTKFAIGIGLMAVILFPIAGTWAYTGAWLYLAYMTVYMIAYTVWLIAVDPDLYNQRMHMFPEGTKPFEKWFYATWRTLNLATYVIAALDVRHGWSQVPGWVMWSAFGVAVGVGVASIWPIVVNHYFEMSVRIQTDRGHRVIDAGPYGWIRHPGYSLALPGIVLTALILESFWALIPCALVVAAFVTRTVLEDRTLQRELEGYLDYTKRVRWRLVPRVW